MRRTRRGGHGAGDFGGSGEDSFVAVVVTKLTGALLFILLMSLVIMALIPKATDLARPAGDPEAEEPPPLAITTPAALPEAIAGRPYAVALAATGGRGPLRWSIEGELPAGLEFNSETGQIRGTPADGTPEPVAMVVRVSDGQGRASLPARLVVFQAEGPLTLPSSGPLGLPPIPWRAWLEQGFGFLVLLLVYLVGRGGVAALERWTASALPESAGEPALRSVRRRFAAYRWAVGLAATASAAALGAWLWLGRLQGLE